MQASDVKTLERTQSADAGADVGPEARDTAARICALMRHVFLYDRGNQLRVVEESGLSSTQCKALLELGGLGDCPSTWQVTDLADLFGASLPAMSRAVDGLVAPSHRQLPAAPAPFPRGRSRGNCRSHTSARYR